MPSKSRSGGWPLSMGTLPLDSIRHFFAKPEPEHFRSLCSILVSMAQSGREDALTLLFGLAHRNRDDLSRMLLFVQSSRGFCHPELVALLASELTRVPSQPSARTYLTTVLESLVAIDTHESWQALLALGHDTRVGPRYRERIRQHLEATAPSEAAGTAETTNGSRV